ncbi:mRNA splicing factor, thioredoxin-like U5 snRNP [Artemisia annua]|uniref:mRNA splicing factor, thioredoxin-like U5 snRNP n=1 Tax=Artemisia annua TaxID=35608 RepID=A0A2U1L389_ARTAN|nr:mRNA splicing factor, thioredoxin-like U5 snRNP [Artemisia annua]
MIDLGTGKNNKINWEMKDKKEFINILETVYRGARKGCDLVIASKDYSSKYHYKLIGTVVLNHNLKDVKPVALSL